MKFRSGRALASGEKGSLSRHGNEPDPAPPHHRTPRHSIIDTAAGARTRLPGTTQHRRFDVSRASRWSLRLPRPGVRHSGHSTARRDLQQLVEGPRQLAVRVLEDHPGDGVVARARRGERRLDVQRLWVGLELRERDPLRRIAAADRRRPCAEEPRRAGCPSHRRPGSRLLELRALRHPGGVQSALRSDGAQARVLDHRHVSAVPDGLTPQRGTERVPPRPGRASPEAEGGKSP